MTTSMEPATACPGTQGLHVNQVQQSGTQSSALSQASGYAEYLFVLHLCSREAEVELPCDTT